MKLNISGNAFQEGCLGRVRVIAHVQIGSWYISDRQHKQLKRKKDAKGNVGPFNVEKNPKCYTHAAVFLKKPFQVKIPN